MSLTSEEVERFMKEVLKFPEWRKSLEEDRLRFLSVVMKYYAHHLSFQNISMASIPPEDRHVPNADEIKHAGITGIGGVCVNQNTFLAMLLKAIGFNAYTVAGFVHGPGNTPDNHVICVVEMSPEEKYMLDVGVALPFEEPIPMHRLPHTNKGAGLRYTYKESEPGSGIFYRVQLDGGLFGAEYTDKNTEFVRYDFKMTPQPLEFFKEPLTPIFKDISHSIFLQHPFMFRYFEEDESGNLLDQANISGNRKWIHIRGLSVLIADNDTRQITHYSTYDEVKEQVIFKYFPHLKREDVEKAVKHFNDTVSEFGYFKAK